MEEKVKPITTREVAKLLSDNNKDEQSAISGYLTLLEKIQGGGISSSYEFKEVITLIEEIIADEMHHSLKLGELTSKLSNIQPNTK